MLPENLLAAAEGEGRESWLGQLPAIVRALGQRWSLALDPPFQPGGLLRRLWREPASGHPFRSLQEMCDQWADEFEHQAPIGAAPLEPGPPDR